MVSLLQGAKGLECLNGLFVVDRGRLSNQGFGDETKMIFVSVRQCSEKISHT